MKDNTRKTWGTNTILNHPRKVLIREGNDPLVSPIHQSVKFQISPDYPYQDQFIYSRVSNPTLKQLEQTLAEIQKTQSCMVLASGIAAISLTMLSLLRKGDHVIAFREMYKPGRIFIRDVLPGYGIDSTILKLNDFESLENSIIPGRTRLIHFESPSNPNLEIADIEKIVGIAKKHNILLSMDGTFAGIHQHTTLGIDIMIHSLTKFGNGHGDVLAGSISGSSVPVERIRTMGHLIGASLDPHAAFLCMRGLKTYMLRYERQSVTAMKVAGFLKDHPKVYKVYYPGLTSHPGHELALKQMMDMGGVLSFTLKPTSSINAKTFCHRLQLIIFSISLGSTESIICPTGDFFGDDLSQDERDEVGIDDFSLRLSVGLEEAEDIIQDLAEALEAL